MVQGFLRVAGVGEVGRGPLAGPVGVTAVVLDPDDLPKGLNDSKTLSEAERN
jgi:ribonuclease HII